MIQNQLPEPVFVAEPAALGKMVGEFIGQPYLAVDTESNSLFAYQEQICLMQFSTLTADYLLDPLALPDLSALAPVFADPKTEKVFHASEYDLICLKRDFGFKFTNIFDTMAAGRILGRTALSLGSILQEEFGLELDKRYQRANWGKRPLTQEMLDYARLDSHYLIPLRERMDSALKEAGLRALAQEDFDRACKVNVPVTDGNNENLWRLVKNQEINPQQAAVLQELVCYRNRQAQSADLPPFKILSNETLMEIALACPKTAADFEGITGLTQRNIDRHGNALLRAVQKGLQAPPLYRPSRPRPDEKYVERVDRLKEWRKVTAREKGVESDVVLPRDILEKIAKKNPCCPENLAPLMADIPWRFEKYGSLIIDSLKVKEEQ
jgi:ribonuclease D